MTTATATASYHHRHVHGEHRRNDRRRAGADPLKQTLAPLAIDIAVPLGGYYLLHAGLRRRHRRRPRPRSVVPAARTIFARSPKREANALAMLMLTVNLVAIALTFVSGNARLMLAKDSAVSSTIALGILWSVRGGKPMMSAGLKPFVTKGDAQPDGGVGRAASRERQRSAPRRTSTA